METPDGPDGSCAGDAPEVAARAATSASASASRDAAAPSAPAESLSRRLYASVSSMFGARGGTGAGSATSDASASARDTTPDADDGGWFNPEAFTVEKRQWLAARRARERGRSASDGGGSGLGDGDASRDASRVGERARDASSADASRPHGPALFDHFLIVGLPTNADVSGVAASARAAKAARAAGAEVSVGDPRRRREHRGPAGETYPTEVLFSYPLDRPCPIDDIQSFCFPHGVEPRLLERTPSMSAMNDIVYGQGHLHADDKSFVFALRAGEGEEGETTYGVCCYVNELVEREPGMMVAARRASRDDGAGNDAGGDGEGTATRRKNGRYLIAADRCYCFVSTSPFFSLHFQVLHAVLGMERLERIRACVEQMMVEEEESDEESNEESNEESDARDGIAASTTDADADAAAAAVSPLIGRRLSFESGGATGDPARAGFGSPVETSSREANTTTGDFARTAPTDETLSRACDALRILTAYRALPPPAPGQSITFAPLRDIKPITFTRRVPDESIDSHARDGVVSADGHARLSESVPPTPAPVPAAEGAYRPDTPDATREEDSKHEPTWKSPSVSRARAAAAASLSPSVDSAAEEASHLETWTVATLCRFLSLDNVLALLNAALLERQIVVFCPNLGRLSAAVLGVVAALRPMRWQSLALPVTPASMLGVLDAPVPFIVGVQRKTSEARRASAHLTRVNLYKDDVKVRGGGALPPLPRMKELAAILKPLHAATRDAAANARGAPVAEPSPAARKAARAFLGAWRGYLRSLVARDALRACAITDVNRASERVSILLKDSFAETFAKADRPFIRAFCETQMFDAFADDALREDE